VDPFLCYFSVVAGAIVAMRGGPLLHAEARLEDELLRLAPSKRPVVCFPATAGADGFVEAITQRGDASVWRVRPDGSRAVPTLRP
jgi:hypothetical protein